MALDLWADDVARLRALEPDDSDLVAALETDSETARLVGRAAPPLARAQLEVWVTRESGRTFNAEDFSWVIEEVGFGASGLLTTHTCNLRTGALSYAVRVLPARRRRGLARHAIDLVLRYYFSELRYQKATVSIHPDNEASIRLHEALGFRCEGRLRRMLFTHGRYIDELWFGMTDDEFGARCRAHGGDSTNEG